jgi:hypothetical protein
MQNMMQKGLSSLLDSSDSNTSNNGALKSALSSFNTLNRDHPLVWQYNKMQVCKTPDQAIQYTQHGVNLLNE